VASLNSPMDFSMYIQNFTHRVSSWLQLGHTPSCLLSHQLDLGWVGQDPSTGGPTVVATLPSEWCTCLH
jgi:hypothetical protein